MSHPARPTRRAAARAISCAGILAALALLAARGTVAATAQPELPQVVQAIVAQTNQWRASQRLAPLRADAALAAAAARFAGHMADSDRYGHDADGRTPAQRARSAGYADCIVLENLAFRQDPAGFRSAALARAFVTGWQGSPPHRRNLLDPDVTQTGVAVAYGARSQRYYAVQLFGRPADAALTFEVANHSAAPVPYRLDTRRFTLPARVTRTHRECTPTTLALDGGGAPIAVVDGGHYAFEPAGTAGVRLARQP